MSDAILLVGCGRMGKALLAGWLDQGIAGSRIMVVEPHPVVSEMPQFLDRGVSIVGSANDLDPGENPAVILLAVKPQAIGCIVPLYQRFVDGDPVFLSIAAGCTLSQLESLLGDTVAIVRSMPNTPAAIRQGITVACANRRTSSHQRLLCHGLLEAVGEVVWIDNENLMDAITAVSGSGPAYLFLLAEELAAAGVAAGLPNDLADRLARSTIAGAGALLASSPFSPSELRNAVTSPGGTTEAALQYLMAPDGLRALLTKAVQSATDRSRSLSRQ